MTSLNFASLSSKTIMTPKSPSFLPKNSFSKLNILFTPLNHFSKLANIQRMRKFSCSSSVSNASEPIHVKEMEEIDAPVKLIYLEGNSWLWDIGGYKILVDPILVGPLDFGIPWLYKAYKSVLKITLDDLPDIDYLLITQSLDDHCHLNTLRPFSQKFPDVKVIATPNAKDLISDLFKDISFLSPGESLSLKPNSDSSSQKKEITVKAVAGPVLGPPWQKPENGYIITLADPKISVFLEPHCQPGKEVEKENADVLITPVIKQTLPYYTLVSGQEEAINLAKTLDARYIVPMANAELDASGLLTALVTPVGSMDKFRELMSAQLPGVQLLIPYPGKPVHISPR